MPPSGVRSSAPRCFARGDEGLPLQPEDEALEARAGSELVFTFGGEEVLNGERGGPGPGHAPLYSGAERIDEAAETWSGPGGTRFVEPEAFPGRHVRDLGARRVGASPAGDRFLVEAALPPGSTPSAWSRVPDLEVTRPYSISPSASFPAGL